MKITIKEIAEMAGVSRATVSKILNDYEDVSESTRKKVMDIIEQTGYRPTYTAHTLATKKSNLIGVIYAGKINASFNHPFFIEVVNSFKKTIGGLGYDLLFFSNEKFTKGEEDYLARCRYYQVDGCILINGDDIQSSILELEQSEIPCIGVDLQLTGENSGYIMTDNHKASAKAVEHLYLLGHRDIAYISGTPSSTIGNIRKEGYIHSLQTYGIPQREEWITYGDFYEESGYRAMQQLLQGERVPTAVFAASDQMAFGAIRAIREKGLSIPQDIAIIGCDDLDACRYVDPPLTTVRQDKARIGKLAARLLEDLINGETKVRSLMVEPELIVRGSCGENSGEE
ncbi:LacI family transcriptional regulator [Brevibacillus humidisoli]|uniref:LacI family DNA-binding transcriptional regulator n=1 Tax=Brevibacillus humidisoli TaxID=2895522 RepID=UPI001E2E47CE|nr:LacI family DNA-binding transcriptional regulator [Brevibacillus humidisoli]UFJ42634.1 LacI family transcriptional regulator [Brevibacillus humidisoli]